MGEGLGFFLWPQRAKPGLQVGTIVKHVQNQHQGELCSNLCCMTTSWTASLNFVTSSLRCSSRDQKPTAGNLVWGFEHQIEEKTYELCGLFFWMIFTAIALKPSPSSLRQATNPIF